LHTLLRGTYLPRNGVIRRKLISHTLTGYVPCAEGRGRHTFLRRANLTGYGLTGCVKIFARSGLVGLCSS